MGPRPYAGRPRGERVRPLAAVHGQKDPFVRSRHRSRADVLQAALDRAGRVYPGCRSISITTVTTHHTIHSLRYTTAVFSGIASTADAAQYALEEGPCLEAIELDHVTLVGTDDLTDDHRPSAWPRFAAAARDLGIGSMISIGIPWTTYWTGPLTPDQPPVGAINFYADRPHQFFGNEIQAMKLGVHIAARLTGADPAEIYDPPDPRVPAEHVARPEWQKSG